MNAAGVIGMLVLLAGGGPAPAKIDVAALVGVWQLCYEPGFPGVSEIDRGFLFLMPKGRYVTLARPQDSPNITESGHYEVTAEGVVLQAEESLTTVGEPGDGRVFKPWHLRLLKDHTVELHEHRGTTTKTWVLTPGPNANYGFAKQI